MSWSAPSQIMATQHLIGLGNLTKHTSTLSHMRFWVCQLALLASGMFTAAVLPPSCLSKQHCYTQDSMIICTYPIYTPHRMCQLQSVLLDVVICLQRVSAQA